MHHMCYGRSRETANRDILMKGDKIGKMPMPATKRDALQEIVRIASDRRGHVLLSDHADWLQLKLNAVRIMAKRGIRAPDQPSSAPAAACEWTQDLDGNWATCCGEMWCLIDGTPTDNDMTYCHHCGKRIKESLYLDPDDDGVEADQPGEVVK